MKPRHPKLIYFGAIQHYRILISALIRSDDDVDDVLVYNWSLKQMITYRVAATVELDDAFSRLARNTFVNQIIIFNMDAVIDNLPKFVGVAAWDNLAKGV